MCKANLKIGKFCFNPERIYRLRLLPNSLYRFSPFFKDVGTGNQRPCVNFYFLKIPHRTPISCYVLKEEGSSLQILLN